MVALLYIKDDEPSAQCSGHMTAACGNKAALCIGHAVTEALVPLSGRAGCTD